MTATSMTTVARPDNVPADFLVDWDIHNPPGGRDDVHSLPLIWNAK